MAQNLRRALVYVLSALLALAYMTVAFSPAWSATGETSVSLVGTVTNPGSVVAGATATQTLSTRYDVKLGPVASGQTWSGATISLYVNQGHFVTAPDVTITDSNGAAVSTTATATGVAATSGTIGGSASYQLSGDLPSGAVLHFSGFALAGFSSGSAGTVAQVITVANGSGNAFRQYATWQTLATIGSGGSTTVVPESGWWWSSAESGRGYAIEVTDGRLMFAAYMYRSDGTSVWYVANGPFSGTEFSGSLYEYRGGGTLSAWQPATPVGSVATIQISFSSATGATLRWSGSAFGSGGTATAIARYAFTGATTVRAPTLAGAPVTGWYWDSDESGTGWFLEMQGNQVFLATYLYDADGTARWYVAQGTPVTTSGVFGSSGGLLLEASLFEYAGGQTLTSGVRSGLQATSRGAVTVQFTTPTTATITLASGRQISLVRFTGF